jgi:hypothetical protein
MSRASSYIDLIGNKSYMKSDEKFQKSKWNVYGQCRRSTSQQSCPKLRENVRKFFWNVGTNLTQTHGQSSSRVCSVIIYDDSPGHDHAVISVQRSKVKVECAGSVWTPIQLVTNLTSHNWRVIKLQSMDDTGLFADAEEAILLLWHLVEKSDHVVTGSEYCKRVKTVVKVKQSHNTPIGLRGGGMYSSYSLTITALDGVRGQRHAPTALYPRGRGPLVSILHKAGWAPEPV